MECNGSIRIKCKSTFRDNSIGMCHAGITCRSQFQFLNIRDRYIQRSRIRRNGFNIENGLDMILQGMVPGSRGGVIGLSFVCDAYFFRGPVHGPPPTAVTRTALGLKLSSSSFSTLNSTIHPLFYNIYMERMSMNFYMHDVDLQHCVMLYNIIIKLTKER